MTLLLNSDNLEKIKFNDLEQEIYDALLDEYNDEFENIININEKDLFAIIINNVKAIFGEIKMRSYTKVIIAKVLSALKIKHYVPDILSTKNIKEMMVSLGNKDVFKKVPELKIDDIYAHCMKCSKCYHICGEELLKPNNNNYIICLKCKMIYKKDLIHLYCKECKEEYYSYIIDNNEVAYENYYPATWDKYHCPNYICEEMTCPKCDSMLYYNDNRKMLYCFECKWNHYLKDMKWKCEICDKEFTSGVKEYIKFETKPLVNCVRNALVNKIPARPCECCCCNAEPRLYIFKHNNEKGCKGNLYLSYLQKKEMVVCSNCRLVQKIKDVYWSCPKCGEFFICNKVKSNNVKEKNGIIKYSKTNYLLKPPSSPNKKNKINVKICNPKNEINMSRNINYEKNKNLRGKSCKKFLMKEFYTEDPAQKNIYSSTKQNISIAKVIKEINELNNNSNSKNNINIEYKKNIGQIDEKEEYSKANNDEDYLHKFKLNQKKSLEKNLINLKEYKYDKTDKNSIKRDSDNRIRSISFFRTSANFGKKNRSIFNYAHRQTSSKGENIENIKYSNQITSDSYKNNGIRDLVYKSAKLVYKNLSNNKYLENRINLRVEENKDIDYIEPDENFIPEDFTIIKQIGEGTFGKIYCSEWIKNKKKYAMKKMILRTKEEVEINQSKTNLLFNFIKTTQSNGVIKLYGAQCEEKNEGEFLYYVLMELADIDWENEIKKRSEQKLYYTEGELFEILKQLVDTYALLQKNNITHRDVKPQNILIINSKYKVCDFGEAKIIATNGVIQQNIRGTELYMSPILFKALNNRQIHIVHNTYKSDVFSLGMCLLLASTLTYHSLYDIREIKNMDSIKNILVRYLIVRYSYNFVAILLKMLEINEDIRPDFIQLQKSIKN